MGNCKSVSASSPSVNSAGNNRKLTLAIVGLDNAGKTVTARCLEGSSVQDVTPTIGFSSVAFSFDKYQISLYDLGGGAKIRNIWTKYYGEVYGFVFVIDASNESRMDECQRVFRTFLESDLVRGKPVLLLANKQDVKGALDEEDIIDALQLEELANQFESPCRVESCTARIIGGRRIDEAIQIGFRWLTRVIESDWDRLSKRVDRDIQINAEIEKREKLERTERVQRSRELREQEKRNSREIGDEEEEDDNSNNGLNPFKPIDQQLVLSQQREATSKKNKNVSSKTNADSENRQRRNDLDNGFDDHRRYGNDDDRWSGGEERSQGRRLPMKTLESSAPQRRISGGEVEATTAERRVYGKQQPEHSPDYSLGSSRRQSVDGRNSTSHPPIPRGSLEPIENGKKKTETTKRKIRLRHNQTAPSPDLDNSDDARPASPLLVGSSSKARGKTKARTRPYSPADEEESYRSDDAKPFAQRWNLANDDMPFDASDLSYSVQKSRNARQPNTDRRGYDLVT